VTGRITGNASSNIPVLESTNQAINQASHSTSALPRRYCHPTVATPVPLNNDRNSGCSTCGGGVQAELIGGSVLVCRGADVVEFVAVRRTYGQVGTVSDIYYKVQIDVGRRLTGYMLCFFYLPHIVLFII
jgi:hypothetical protein